ncbi:MAG: hypothetical protein GF392_03485, partial [Candidatus Omnitrophica bacterium]|nr:hypothetical protein [Candidatus Omnitrophota bacterium]
IILADFLAENFKGTEASFRNGLAGVLLESGARSKEAADFVHAEMGKTEEARKLISKLVKTGGEVKSLVDQTSPANLLIVTANSAQALSESIQGMVQNARKGVTKNLTDLLFSVASELNSSKEKIRVARNLGERMTREEVTAIEVISSPSEIWKAVAEGKTEKSYIEGNTLRLSIDDLNKTADGKAMLKGVAQEKVDSYREYKKLTREIAKLKSDLENVRSLKEYRDLSADIARKEQESATMLAELKENKSERVATASLISLVEKGYMPHQEQVAVVQSMTNGKRQLVELLTGEGKATVGQMTTFAECFDSEGSLAIDPQEMLAERDYFEALETFADYGIEVGYVNHSMSDDEKQLNYAKDITYTDVGTAAFDVDHDLDVADVESHKRLIRRDLGALRDMRVVVDEADSILLDQAMTAYIRVNRTDDIKAKDALTILAAAMAARDEDVDRTAIVEAEGRIKEPTQQEKEKQIKKAGALGVVVDSGSNRSVQLHGSMHNAALESIRKTLDNTDFRAEAERRLDMMGIKADVSELLEEISGEIGRESSDIAAMSSEEVARTMAEEKSYLGLMQDAMTAVHAHEKGVDYSVRGGGVTLVHKMTGVNSDGQRLKGGEMASLHQLLEAKEGLAIRGEGQSSSQITAKQLFVNIFRHTVGMTGTLGRSNSRESELLKEVYDFERKKLPPHHSRRRIDVPKQVFLSNEARIQQTINDLKAARANGQAVLLNVDTMEQAEDLYEQLAEAMGEEWASEHLELYTAKQQHDFARIQGKAGIPGNVTIATAISGRGTDLMLNEMAKQKGLLVISHCLHTSQRVERQLRGRSGRQGAEGETRIYVTLEKNSAERNMLEQALSKLREKGIGESRFNDVLARAKRLFDSAETQRELETEENQQLLRKALEYTQMVYEDLFAKEVTQSAARSDIFFKNIMKIREVQYQQTAKAISDSAAFAENMVERAQNGKNDHILIQRVDAILSEAGEENNDTIARLLQSELGLYYTGEVIQEIRESGNTGSFRTDLLYSVSQSIGRDLFDRDVEDIRKEFSHSVELLTRTTPSESKRKAIVERLASEAIAKMADVNVNAGAVSSFVSDKIQTAQRSQRKLDILNERADTLTAKLKSIEREISEAAPEEKPEMLYEKYDLLVQLGGTYDDLKSADVQNADYYEALISDAISDVTALEHELGLGKAERDAKAGRVTPDVKVETQKGLLHRMLVGLGVRNQFSVANVSYTVRSTQTQAPVNARQIREQFAARAEAVNTERTVTGNMSLDSHFTTKMVNGNQVGVLTCPSENAADVINSARLSGRLTPGMPVVYMPDTEQ